MTAHRHHWWQQERLLVQAVSLLFVAAWLVLFVLVVVRVLRPELRQLEVSFQVSAVLRQAAVLHPAVAETRLDREAADVIDAERRRREPRGGRRRRQAAARVRLERSADVRSAAEREAFHRVYAACAEMAAGVRRLEQAAGILRMLRQQGVFDQEGRRRG